MARREMKNKEKQGTSGKSLNSEEILSYEG
jgi:hypothetical protein